MNVGKHISKDIKPLVLEGSVDDALSLMEEMKLSHLPVVDEAYQYLGVVNEETLLEAQQDGAIVSQCARFFQAYSANLDSHVLEVARIASDGILSMVPIVDKENIYRGYISPLELLQDLGSQITFKEEGGVLVLKIPSSDYQLSQIAQIVESEDARILGLIIGSASDINSVDVTIKINQKDLGRIIKSFERYSYSIIEVYHQSLFDDSATQRYESLMRYLNI